MICFHLRQFQFYSFTKVSNRIWICWMFFFLLISCHCRKIKKSILPPFSESLLSPLLLLLLLLWSLCQFQTRSRVNTLRLECFGCLLFFHSMEMRLTTAHNAFPRVQWNITKQSHRINLQKVYFFLTRSRSLSLKAIIVWVSIVIGCCVIMYDFQWNEMNWIEKKKRTESEMNAEGMLRCKHCEHFLFQFSICMNMYWWLSTASTRWWYTHTLHKSGSLPPLLLLLLHLFLFFIFIHSWPTVCVRVVLYFARRAHILFVCLVVKSCRIFDWPWPRYLSHSSSSYFCTFDVHI